MGLKSRIAKLELRLPPQGSDGTFQPNFEFRVAGRPRNEVQAELIRRLKEAIADPRANEEQRANWTESIRRIEAAMAQSR